MRLFKHHNLNYRGDLSGCMMSLYSLFSSCCSHYTGSSAALRCLCCECLRSSDFTLSSFCFFFIQSPGLRVSSSSRAGCRAPPLTPAVSTHCCQYKIVVHQQSEMVAEPQIPLLKGKFMTLLWISR